MLLPGGISTATGLDRTYAFKPLTGAVELSIAEALEAGESWPLRISRSLAAALESVGGAPAGVDPVHALSLGDRQFLVRRLGIALRGDETWLTSSCGHCREPFNVPVRYSELPVKQAGGGYPYASILTSRSRRPLRFRVPSGRDQEAIQAVADRDEIRQVLARRLLVDELAESERFPEEDLEVIERALEDLSPEVGTQLQVTCPSCAQSTVAQLDPWSPLRGDLAGTLLSEVDRLATHYHWGEGEILNMPRRRRQRYLSLIDRRRGVRTSESLRSTAS